MQKKNFSSSSDYMIEAIHICTKNYMKIHTTKFIQFMNFASSVYKENKSSKPFERYSRSRVKHTGSGCSMCLLAIFFLHHRLTECFNGEFDMNNKFY